MAKKYHGRDVPTAVLGGLRGDGIAFFGWVCIAFGQIAIFFSKANKFFLDNAQFQLIILSKCVTIIVILNLHKELVVIRFGKGNN